MKQHINIVLVVFCQSLFIISNAKSQTIPLNVEKPVINAFSLGSEKQIILDGNISEQAWLEIPFSTKFVQTQPNDGSLSTEKTQVRIAYDSQYLYVAIEAFDSAPDSVASSLFRRDGSGYSDWVYVSIDSYNDNRTAFTFAVNPEGVQKDILYYNDEEEDLQWDAVWDVATTKHFKGWSAEFRIPFSQLRFNASNSQQNWGVNFKRYIARKEETSNWAHVPREEFGKVSWFGEIQGIENLGRPLRLEVLPYISISDTREPEPEILVNGNKNVFYNADEVEFKIGGDIKYGITSDFTLTATINPDFGQVEADPSTINLTQFETFFTERRPFFLEGSEIFSFGGSNSSNTYSTHQTFYSRRIGRSPFGTADLAGVSSEFEDRPTQTTIAGATKISGKTNNGLSLGILDTYTLQENAVYVDGIDNGMRRNYEIEPSTNYLVARVKQDLRDGDAQIGGFASAVNRMFSDNYLENYLHDSAYQLGMDGQYNWANRSWGASGSVAISSVNGTENAILNTQQSYVRYYDRVDSDYLKVDSSTTNLTGYSAEFSIGKYAGSGLRYSITYSETSPSYEINDIGYQGRADYRAPHYYVDYLKLDSEYFRYYLLWVYGGYAWNFDGDMVMNFHGGGGFFQFNNLWTMTLTGGLTGTFYNDRITWGGPIMRRPKDWNSSIDISTNATKDFYISFGGSYRKDASGEFTKRITTAFNYRPTPNIQLQLSPTYSIENNTDQFIGFFDVNNLNKNEYVFSSTSIEQFNFTMRLDWTFSPRLSLQTYVRPLISSIDFSDFKSFSERKTYNFKPTTQQFPDTYDFERHSIQGNAVLRWEYRPGSTFYIVWQQQREQSLASQSNFSPYFNTIDILKESPTNIFLIKFSYWIGN
mgnify:CR=1 FL=1|tara:strand:- start:2962 stop:5583 length:2622 start_codon:yes stop_codon:yes gene_type:complete